MEAHTNQKYNKSVIMNIIKSQHTFSIFMILFIVGCNDNPLVPEYGTISGVIDFTGVWPVTGNISISLNTTWPEVIGAPYAFKTIDSSDLNQDSLYNYSFKNVAFNTYQGIIVSWKDPTDPSASSNQHAIGGYGATVETEFKDAENVMITVADFALTGLDFSAYLNLIVETMPAESGNISGIVTFSGTWPMGTVFMSLNSLWPLQTTPNYYSTIASENLIDNKYSYRFENITFGIYTIAVVWLNPDASWETVGAYGSETPPEFEDAENVTITVIDFELTGLDFSAIFRD